MITYIIKRLNFLYLFFNWITKSFIYFFYKNQKIDYTTNDCEIYYINLDHRIDRDIQIKNEFYKLGIFNYKKFNAIYNLNGALGCAKSHKEIYEMSCNTNKLIFICEDDVIFHCSKNELDKLVEIFFNDKRLDVLCVANLSHLHLNVNNNFKITSSTQTMSCYIIKPHMIKLFIAIANESITGLLNEKDEKIFSIDQLWKRLQSKYIFAIPKFKFASQGISYSDIQKKIVDYNV